MKTDIDTLIAEVLRLDGEATPGPWRPVGASIRVHLPGGIEYQWATAAHPRDNNLTAHYRTAAPILAAEVQRLRDEVRKLKLALVERIGEDRALEDCVACSRPTQRIETSDGAAYRLCPACAIKARDEASHG